jgi:hypothetical protein
MLDLQIWIPIISLLVAAYGVHLQRQQIKLMRGATETDKPPIPVWWRTPTVIALVVLAALAWVPWLLTPKISRPQFAVTGCGLVQRQPELMMHVNAGIFIEDKSIKLMAVAFHYKGTTDVMDVKELQKSALYDVRPGNQILLIKADDNFVSEVNAGQAPTNYQLFAVPAGIDPAQVTTSRHLIALGGRLIWGGSGPP